MTVNVSKPVTVTLPFDEAWVLIEAAYRGADWFDDQYKDMGADGLLDDMPFTDQAIAFEAGNRIRRIAKETLTQVRSQRGDNQ